MIIDELLAHLKANGVIPKLEGEQLKIVGDVQNISPELLAQLRSKKVELIDYLRQYVEQVQSLPVLLIKDKKSYIPTSVQKAIWTLSRTRESQKAYIIVTGLIVKYALNQERLQTALNLVIAQHESLRTIFLERNGELSAMILNQVSARVSSDLPNQVSRRMALTEGFNKVKNAEYDLASGPLIRVHIVPLSPQEGAVFLGLHHIISDGTSVAILLKDLFQYYSDSNQVDSAFSHPTLQYSDFAVSLNAERSMARHSNASDFWKALFFQLPEALNLPCDFKRSEVRSYEGDTLRFKIDLSLFGKIRRFVHQHNLTVFNFFYSILAVLISKLSGQYDLVIGTPVSTRTRSVLEGMIGPLVNTLPLRITFLTDDSFLSLVKKVSNNLNFALQHHDFPFEAILSEADASWDQSRSPLFDVFLAIQDFSSLKSMKRFMEESGVQSLDDLSTDDSPMHLGNTASKFDLSFGFFIDTEQHCYLEIEYASTLFLKERILDFYRFYLLIISKVLERPEDPLSKLELIDHAERRELLEEFQGGVLPVEQGVETLLDLFARQALARGSSPAVVFGDRELSYAELDQESNRLADYLRRHYGVVPDDRVGICLERSEWMIISVLGVLKSGGAYVPIDPDYPSERIAYMQADSSCRLLLDEQELARYRAVREECSEQRVESGVRSHHLAYVIYTSGTTGQPKGVMIEHRNVCAFFKNNNQLFSGGSTTAFITNLTFDISVLELLGSLVHGLKIFVVQNSGPQAILEAIRQKDIDILQVTPSRWDQLLEENGNDLTIFNLLSTLLIGGEALGYKRYSRLKELSTVCVQMVYGPTETTIWSSALDIHESEFLSLGKSLSRELLYVLSGEGHLQPVGVSGEICIGGQGVGRGYINNAELTSLRFVADPFRQGGRMYRTGDLGRWLESGEIEFLGRADDQVKIRGYRIELGEIESRLQQHSGVDSAVVTAYAAAGSTERELVAYVVGRDLQAGDLRGYLSAHLPSYMLPSYYVELSSLPLNRNGKVDKARLPAPQASSLPSGAVYVAPRNATEEALCRIWQELLGREQVSVTDHFFELGGHSLKATRLISQIHKELQVRLGLGEVFAHPVLAQMAGVIDGLSGQPVYEPISQAEPSGSYVMSSSQRRLWILSQLGESNQAYNMPGVYLFQGELDREALERSFSSLLERHEILRTVFRADEAYGGEVRQVILAAQDLGFSVSYQDLEAQHPGLSVSDRERLAADQISRSVSAPFDLVQGPLLRAELYCLGPGRWLFSYVMHHIISDGWSMGILIGELLSYYHDYKKGAALALPPLPIQYKDYATWQQGQLGGAENVRHRDYWLGEFTSELPVLELAGDHARPQLKSYAGGVFHGRLSPSVGKGLHRFCRSRQSTLFMGLLAGLNALLYRMTQQSDLIIGTPIAGREHTDLEGQIGFYVNTLAIRTRFSADQVSFARLLDQVRDQTLQAYEHQSYPFDELVDSLDLRRDMSRSPLFDVMLVLQNASTLQDQQVRGLEGVQVSAYEGLSSDRTSKFDLVFNFVEESDEQISYWLEYNRDIYDAGTAERLVLHYGQLLERLLESPDAVLGRVDYLSESERRELLEEFQGGVLPVEQGVETLLDLFARQALARGSSPAVVFGDRELSYAELDQESNRLADYLRRHYGVVPDDRVGICLERSEWMIISVLGVLKSGGAYVPIDPDYPSERIAYMQADSSCRLLLDEQELARYRAVREECSEQRVESGVRSHHLAYVIYTSGTTGQPKGVMIEHRNVCAFIQWCHQEFKDSAFDKAFAMTSLSFDISVFEIFYTLMRGKTLHVLSSALSLPAALGQKDKVLLNTVPSVVGALLSSGADWSSVGVLNMAGEALPLSYLRRLPQAGMEVRNLYGPTECTIYSTCWRIREDAPERVLIGRPIAGTSVYVLSGEGHLQPVGVSGEICIGGQGVGRGYINNAELTSLRFVADPFRQGGRMYRTGDLGRWLESGEIEFLGRADDQVKIRGYRIELGEIESRLQQHSGVDSAVVTAYAAAGSTERELVAYVVGRDLQAGDLRGYLSAHLPSYMLPSYYVELSSLPLNRNGKVDKARLPAPQASSLPSGAVYVAPRNATEEALCRIWQELLGREQVSVTDHFFELGGHSLMFIRMVNALKSSFDIEISLKEVFNGSTIEDISQMISRKKWLKQQSEETKSEMKSKNKIVF